MRNVLLLGIVLSLLLVPGAMAASTQQYNQIYLSPYYRASMTSGTNYTYSLIVLPPDNIGRVVSALVKFDVYVTPTVTYNAFVNGQPCATPSYIISTTYSGASQARISFDCSNVISEQGTYSVTINANKNSGAIVGWLELTYENTPASMETGATDYYLDNSSATVFAKVYEGKTAVSNGFCSALVFYPNGTQFTSFSMDYMTGSRGLYSKTFAKPTVADVYPVDVECVRPFNATKQNRLIASNGGEFFMNQSGIGTATKVITDMNQNTGEVCFDSWDERTSDFPSTFQSYRFLENVTNVTLWLKQGVGSNTFIVTLYFYKMTDKGEINVGQTSLTTLLTNVEAVYTLPNERLDFVWDETSLLKARLCVISTTTTVRTLTFYYNSTTRYSGFQINTMNINTSLDFVVGGASELNVRDPPSVLSNITLAINNSAKTIWEYPSRNLTYYPTVNATINSTGIVNYTYFGEQFNDTNSLIGSVNASISGQLDQVFNSITSNIVSINNTILSINSSLTAELNGVKADIYAVNASIFGKLILMQDEIASVNDTVKAINSSLSQQMSSLNFTTDLTGVYGNLSAIQGQITSTNSSLSALIGDVSNSVYAVNGSLSTQLTNVQNDLNSLSLTVTDTNNTVNTIYYNAGLNKTIWQKLVGIQDEITSVNNTVKSESAYLQSLMNSWGLNISNLVTYWGTNNNATTAYYGTMIYNSTEFWGQTNNNLIGYWGDMNNDTTTYYGNLNNATTTYWGTTNQNETMYWGSLNYNTTTYWGGLNYNLTNYWGGTINLQLYNLTVGNVSVNATVDYDEIALTVMSYLISVDSQKSEWGLI